MFRLPICVRLFNDCHRILMQGVRGAGKAIELLVTAGILTKVGERKRDRLYRYQNYLRLLE